MKKLTTIIAILFLAVVMFSGGANAITLNDVTLNVSGSFSQDGFSSGTQIELKSLDLVPNGFENPQDAFCVEESRFVEGEDYDLYQLSSTQYLSEYYHEAIIADLYFSGADLGLPDAIQGDYQVAIWLAADLISDLKESPFATGESPSDYSNALVIYDYAMVFNVQNPYTFVWDIYLAHNETTEVTTPAGGRRTFADVVSQDFLIGKPVPVPEPASMLLLGGGLLGLAIIGRKRFTK